MRKFLVAGMLLVSLASCAPRYKYAADYDMGITKAAVAGQIVQGAKGMSYQDDLLDITFEPDKEGLSLRLKNLSSNSFKVLWDDTVLISPSGESLKVFRSETRLINKDQPQAPSLVPPGGKVTDTIYPSSYTYFVNSGRYSHWKTEELVPGMYMRATPELYPDFQKSVLSLKGHQLHSLLLTLETSTGKVEYLFEFQIKDVSIREIDEPVPLNLGPQFN